MPITRPASIYLSPDVLGGKKKIRACVHPQAVSPDVAFCPPALPLLWSLLGLQKTLPQPLSLLLAGVV
jgi:hypothetical protein